MPNRSVMFLSVALLAASCCHPRPKVDDGPAVWRTAPLPAAPQDISIVAVTGSSGKDIWALGKERSTSRPILYHYDGSLWLIDPVSSKFPGAINDIVAAGPRDVWMVGDGGIMAHHDGTDWTITTLTKTVPQRLGHVDASKAGVWVTVDLGRPAYYRLDGTEWVFEEPSTIPTQRFEDVWGSASNDVWVVGGRVAHFDGKGWADQTVGKGTMNAVAGTARDDVWILGGRGSQLDIWERRACAFHYDGAAWSEVPLPEGALYLHAIHAVARNEVYAVGNGGDAIRWDGVRWQRTLTGLEHQSGLPSLAGVYCPPGGKPVAGGYVGPVMLHGL